MGRAQVEAVGVGKKVGKGGGQVYGYVADGSEEERGDLGGVRRVEVAGIRRGRWRWKRWFWGGEGSVDERGVYAEVESRAVELETISIDLP